jgi:serine/threonine protein kinase
MGCPLTHLRQVKEIVIKATESNDGRQLIDILKELFELVEEAMDNLPTLSNIEIALLKHQVNVHKQSVVSILWNHCAPYHPMTRHIPPVEDPKYFLDNDSKLGDKYSIGSKLGEGKYASVMACTRIGSGESYALKMIDKAQIMTFNALCRVSTEVENLKKLSSKYVVSFEEAIQTSDRLYLVMEMGNSDLYTFLEDHPNGIDDGWARQIVWKLLGAVSYIHQNGICHRDIKPENVLMNFDKNTGKCLDLKLCDFGLSTKFQHNKMLSDFCGSPGYFEPEMVIEKKHYGDMADIWSVGAIILELTLGHDRFCSDWMVSYSSELINNQEQFAASIRRTVNNLPNILNFSIDLNNFVLSTLVVSSVERISMINMLSHPWFADIDIDVSSILPPSEISQRDGVVAGDTKIERHKLVTPPIKVLAHKKPSSKPISSFSTRKYRKI